MKRYVGINLEHITSHDEATNVTKKIFPKWAHSNNINSIAHSDISEAISELNSLSFITQKYENIMQYGGIFDHHTLWLSDDNPDTLNSTEIYYDFISQIPTVYRKKKTLNLNKCDTTGLISYETSLDLEKENILIKGYNETKTFYITMDFNYNVINDYYINETRKQVNTFPFSESDDNFIYITNRKDIEFIKSDDYEIFYKVNIGYNKKIDTNNDGYISENDVKEYCSKNNLDFDKYKHFIGCVSKTGFYATYKNNVEIQYYNISYEGILDQSIVFTNNNDIKKAVYFNDSSELILTNDGSLSLSSFNINSKISSDEKIINFDILGDNILFISEVDDKQYIYLFSPFDNEIYKIINLDRKYEGIVCLPNDYIYLIVGQEIDLYKPYYTTSYFKNNKYYHLSNVNDLFTDKIDLKSVKLFTYLDYIAQVLGIQRWYNESLYNFYGRLRKINSIENCEFNNIISEHLSIEPEKKYKPIYTTFINQIISEIHPNTFIEINSMTYRLNYKDGSYYYNDLLVFAFKNKIITVYDSILDIPATIRNGKYLIKIQSDSGLKINFFYFINNINFEYLSNIKIENVDKDNVVNSSVIFNKNYNSIYKTKDSYSGVQNGLTEFDSFNSVRFDYQGEYTKKENDDFQYSLPNSTYGLWDGYSFGDHEISIVKTVLPVNIEVINDEKTDQDENTLLEISNDGSNQLIKFSCNSGFVVDNGTIKLYGSFSNSGNDYFRKIRYTPEYYDEILLNGPTIEFDNNNFTYLDYNKILHSDDDSNGFYIYDTTGRMELYIQKQLLSTGPVYVTLKDTEYFPGRIKLLDGNIITYDTKTTLPKPTKIEVVYEKKSKSDFFHETYNRYFSDSYFNVFETSVSNSLLNDSPLFSRNISSIENKKTLYSDDRTSDDIIVNISNTYLNKDILDNVKMKLCDLYIDGMIIKEDSIESQYNSWIEYIKTFSYLFKTQIIQKTFTSTPPTKDYVVSEFLPLIPEDLFIVDTFLFLDDYYINKTNGFEYHYKENFEKCYNTDNSLREYLFLNNLFNNNSYAYIQLANVGAFKKDQKYVAISIVAPRKVEPLYE